MNKNYLMSAVACLLLSSFTAQAQNANDEKTAGIKKENRDESKRPGDDFFEYANGGWMKANPLTKEYGRYGAFEVLEQQNTIRLHNLVDDLSSKQHEHGTVAQKVADIYRLANDSVRRNKEGYEPIKADMKTIASIKDRVQYFNTMAEMSVYGVGAFFRAGIDTDMKNSKVKILDVSQGGLGLGQKDYYVETDENTVNIRNKYQDLMVDLFTMVGYNASQARTKMQDVMRIETRLANASLSRTEMRDPAAMYHKMSYNEFEQQFNKLDWDTYFGKLGLQPKDVNVGNPKFLTEVENIITTENLDALKNYLEWNLIDEASNMLSDAFGDRAFEFSGKVMMGTSEQSPRWKRSIQVVNRTLGMALGQMYVEKYFPAAAKERMVQLVKNLQTALGQRIDAQDWMSDATKKRAHEKLDAFYIKIGYPDEWKDYSSLDIDPSKSFYENMKAVQTWNWKDRISKQNDPVDPTEWFMTPQTVNAYYNPSTNEICFPAGILQYPFFDMDADDAFNYGAIGVVIGHEMTHGFDDEGSQFDKEGNFNSWWEKEDREKFDAKTTKLAEWFDHIVVLESENLHGNGRLTLGENLADHGGLEVSYQAFKNATAGKDLGVKDGLTPEQRFFIAYASVWGQNVRDEEIRRRTKSDPHSLGRWRVNGTLPHIDAWYEAFGVKEGDKMYIPVEQRVFVW